ncbi:hypothetical protein D8M34_06740 [Microbacterium sp. HSID17254]|uniref:hypothetical protein n=1 Tax=Microbacterium sp. HSID17254 TaxID=2419509 RepID=UPI000F899EF0|nr:hypothetical protein [Microbacterium sp. HSID17254]RUQ06711.1 hypothetical protein D8M34_06740 [Microbacterium sp. HSID17254]
MDVSDAIVAKSDQLNAIDLVGRDVTVTIVDVKPGSADQPVHIITDTYGPARPWKPSKTALRDIVQAWGTDSTVWVGRRITLFNDPEVLWAGQPVGGIRIRAMSHIDKAFEAKHVITRGKTKKVMIQPLTDAPVDRSKVDAAHAAINQATTTQKLDEIAAHATRIGIHNQVKDAIETRRAELEK